MGGLEAGHGQSWQDASAAAQPGAEPRLIFVLRVVGVVLALLPVLVTLVKPFLPPVIGDFMYVLFTPVCHNDPSRTLKWFGVLMPLCSRCFGIFLGFGTAGLFPRPKWSIGQSLWYGFWVSVLMVEDVLMQDLGLHPVWHGTRILTGVIWGHICGIGVGAVGRWVFEGRARS